MPSKWVSGQLLSVNFAAALKTGLNVEALNSMSDKFNVVWETLYTVVYSISRLNLRELAWSADEDEVMKRMWREIS